MNQTGLYAAITTAKREGATYQMQFHDRMTFYRQHEGQWQYASFIFGNKTMTGWEKLNSGLPRDAVEL